MKLLVTGGAGFIGSAVVRQAVAQGNGMTGDKRIGDIHGQRTLHRDSAQRVRAYNAKAEILNLSSFTGLGIDQLVDRILDWKE